MTVVYKDTSIIRVCYADVIQTPPYGYGIAYTALTSKFLKQADIFSS